MRAEGPQVVARATPVQDSSRAAPVQVAQGPVTPAAGVPLAALPPGSRPRHSREPDSYVVPAGSLQGPALVAPTELANYIVAHSEYSAPLMRRNALSALVAGDSAVPQVTAQPIAATVVTGK